MTNDCVTHCHREFFHKQWKILLDDEFLEAYEHDVIILCCDGLKRRFYPRIFTYSADSSEQYINFEHEANFFAYIILTEYLLLQSETLEDVHVLAALYERIKSKTWECLKINSNAQYSSATTREEE